MSERTILITGATDGLGRYLAIETARAGARVLLHGRDRARADEVRARILAEGGREPDIILADLADLSAVDRLAAEVESRTDRLDVLVNNAGIGFGAPGGTRELSADGIELRFAVNYLAVYRLTHLLQSLLVRSAPSRIVNVASIGQEPLDFDNLMLEHDYSGVSAYRRAKLAEIMFTFDLAAELAPSGVTVNAIHPASLMNTTMVRQADYPAHSTIEEGGAAVLHLINDEVGTGHYFDGLNESRANPQAYDPAARRGLRRHTTALLTALHAK
ncbi:MULTISPECIES: SDR family NAD(P)-dependent oxidoreductase [unclassified Nocardia]|uniref:SDR family NAD(P)-dependent oxidoreductase n=1 Tax=unclassified Nocardia TaxID=2637762 RepID=UPI001CE405A4|nr:MULTISPECIES: SDR family NAD(P)-dependent oxidoreductase [unclassified Nocardia]